MAAYAALVSVMQIIDQIQRHLRPPIAIHEQQSQSLTQVVTFLQDFLEDYNPHVSYTTEADPLESRIAEAAYAAEDVIESYIVDQIHARYKNDPGTIIRSVEFYQDLQKVIEEMNLIKMDVVEIKQKKGVQIKRAMVDATSFRSTSTVEKVSMVGFDDVLNQMLDKVTGGGPHLQIIPIVGMGGIGKTTLARNTYVNPLVKEHFDVRAWSTISQDYDALEILKKVLDQVDEGQRGNLKEDEIGEHLYKCLIGKRYLVVMDDMWSIKVWDIVRRFFPGNEYGSRVVITTRLTNLASQFNRSNNLKMEFLDEVSSWNLFSKTVFRDENCPLELDDIARKVVEGCKGLPLSISVIGGLLSRTRRTRDNWQLIEENLSSIVNSEENESCLQILYTSYNNLPIYLKPCFLYMTMFAEDESIETFILVRLWVAEGFLKPVQGKSLEEVGEMYLEELVDRNLILVEDHNTRGKLLSFKIHDLLRDLSLREARKLKFSRVLGEQSIHDVSQRRLVCTLSKYPTPILQPLESASLFRSLLGSSLVTLSHNFRLLRVSMCPTRYFVKKSIKKRTKTLLELVNLRFFYVGIDGGLFARMPSLVSLLWNLQTIIFSNTSSDYIFEIWKMPQLRHVITLDGGRLDGPSYFPDYSLSGEMDEVVMENLQTLKTVSNLSSGVLNKIPNMIWLGLHYNETLTRDIGLGGDYCLNNLSRLQKLESLHLEYSCDFQQHTLTHLVTFPYSLKELTLVETRLHWEDMQTKIGLLPLLQSLILVDDACIGSEWETFEGQFSSLRSLSIKTCVDLKDWKTDNTHFPRLEYLNLRTLRMLDEIPLSIGDIPTLRSINLDNCSPSAMDSARRIQEEQEALGNEDLQIGLGEEYDESYEYVTTYKFYGKTNLGENLCPLVHQLEQQHARKVTGMLLELDEEEILHLIKSPDALKDKVSEAMEVLRDAGYL